MHINQQPHTHPENFRALAFTVLAGEATRRKKLKKKKTQGSKIRTGPLYYSIVGTVKKNPKAVRLELGHYVVVGTVKTNQGSEIRTWPLY